MTFVQIEKRNGMIGLDGYSRNKTLKGALKDLAREVAKIDKTEADGILNNIDEMAGMATAMMNIPNEWYIEAQEVHCASRRSEKNDEMEYAEGHWYLYIRFVAPEQETAQAASDPVETKAASTLTEDEVKFFNDTVARIKYSVNVNVPIEPMDHEQLTGTNKEALGICWALDDGTGKPAPYRITIDEFFIHECFVALDEPCMKIIPETLEQVIAHEIAHLRVWRHGKKHTELTERICRLIEKGEPHGMGGSGTAPTIKTGQVAMAAMQPASTEPQNDAIEIISAVPEEDMRWFSAQHPHHNAVGFMRETYRGGSRVTRVILKMKPGHKGWTPFGAARDCGDHYIIARYSQYDRVDKKTLAITRDVDDK